MYPRCLTKFRQGRQFYSRLDFPQDGGTTTVTPEEQLCHKQ